jgi:hypothetical protein
MRNGGQLSPITVEATKTGWLSIAGRIRRAGATGSAAADLVFAAGYFRHGKSLDMRSALFACAGACNEEEQPIGECIRPRRGWV